MLVLAPEININISCKCTCAERSFVSIDIFQVIIRKCTSALSEVTGVLFGLNSPKQHGCPSLALIPSPGLWPSASSCRYYSHNHASAETDELRTHYCGGRRGRASCRSAQRSLARKGAATPKSTFLVQWTSVRRTGAAALPYQLVAPRSAETYS